MVMAITLLGKVLGLFRDHLMAVHYGTTGMEAKAFYIASRIPRVFFDVVFASAIAACFIPVFSEYLTQRGKKEAFRFGSNFLSVMALLTAVLTVLGILFAQPLVTLFADGYDPQTAELAASLTRVMFPTVLFTGVAFSFVGILQAMDRFNIPALISTVSNLVIIGYFFFLDERFGVYGLAGAYLLGWLLQAVVQAPSLRQLDFRYRPDFSFRSEGMRKAFALMGPVMISTWVQPINLTINTKFGSRLYEGAGVSAMEYSTNLYLVIAGVFILSITNVIFPRLSRLTAEHQEGAFRDTLRQTVHGSLFFVLPMAAGLMVLARPMVSFLYGGGEFDAFSVSITSEALVWVSLGMVGYGLQNILSRAYFARQDGRTPLVAGGVSILANILLCMVLTEPMGVAGLAIASTVSSTLYAGRGDPLRRLWGGLFENAGVHGGDGGGGLAGPEQPVRPSARGQSGGAASAGGLRGAGGGGLFPAGRPDASGGDGAGPGSDETNLETRLRYGTNANDRAGQRRVPGAGGPVPVVRRAVEGQRAHSVVHPPPAPAGAGGVGPQCLCPALAVDPRRTVPPVPGPAPGQAV